MSTQEKAKQYEPAKEISSPDGFINTDNITIEGLVGKKVVLVDFWTYSCINCQRTTPYLNAWYEKYADQGLEIIGIHTPEFEFEKDYNNVLAATKKFDIKYPVVLDNDYSTWTAYRNRYWPRKYLVDIDGFIVYDHIGEGGYEETEKKIQELLRERAVALNTEEAIAKDMVKPTQAENVDFTKTRSPEIYFGAARNLELGNGDSQRIGEQTLKAPETPGKNKLYLDGKWEFTEEFATNESKEAKIIFRYEAEKVFFVGSADTTVRVRILRDGKPIGAAAGKDVIMNNGDAVVNIHSNQLYRLIEDPAGHGEHTLEIIIENPGLKAFTFTFG
ncbi:MAG: thiol-disulfide isomerase [Candidatus Harrisonbacteria bacterium CG10_big_fil_rev_8_21_14_0_10_42_17]|uniref:Thiol-disulfide isomerase n=1 Tax=Candidatus Harrisonbacteria bacterium CG10_big_fil_rev_8_21_14_0_10_42_17 TaxID=1974584 RepID=A0A2M6WIR0_9BACT|nr:MAG: thiol-disulfide isomerase [Candidatus Harrisonbacteria bacterium CG10_big_fil_rev_8_21_14_0_10_42_17]